jgi:hypothetical protein
MIAMNFQKKELLVLFSQALELKRVLKQAVVLTSSVVLLACSSAPPTPEWKLQARDATERATAAYLSGQSRVAQAEWLKAKQEARRTAQPEQVARVILAQCALRLASLEMSEGVCEELTPLVPDLSPSLQAYHRYLQGQVTAADLPLLPPAHQAVAQRLLAQTEVTAVIQAMPDPVSKLVAAAVALRSTQAQPSLLVLGVDTASQQGWSRPVLAWLGAYKRWAEQTGQTQLAEQLQRRIDVVLKP